MSYAEAVQWLYGSQWHGIKLGLEVIVRLLDALGVRRDGAAALRFIHVAGTNGKGSVCAMIDAISRAGGVRTGLFTSPHLVSFRERIRVDGAMISAEAAAAGLAQIRGAVAGWEQAPTFFEITTALALAHFQNKGVELAILETGLGGRLDATNAVTPLVSVLTPIGLDHQAWLGETLAEIAREKAGIIKPGVPVVSAPQPAEARRVLSEVAAERGAPWHGVTAPLEGVAIGLEGSHQRWNAALAVEALKLAGAPASGEAIATGLAEVQWPGRFQVLADGTVLDGAHNPAAAQRLAETWREVFGERQATVVLGVLRDKDARGICAALAPIAARVWTVAVRSERSLSAEELREAFAAVAPQVACVAAGSLAEARKAAQACDERILIAGSLFLVGEVLRELQGGGDGVESLQ